MRTHFKAQCTEHHIIPPVKFLTTNFSPNYGSYFTYICNYMISKQQKVAMVTNTVKLLYTVGDVAQDYRKRLPAS